MTALVFLTLGCIFEGISTPIESAIRRPRLKVYRKPNQKKERFY